MANSTAVYMKGRANTKQKLSLTTRVANNSQKKMDTLARIDGNTLKTMYRFYDLEMLIHDAEYKKSQQQMQGKINKYQQYLKEYKVQRQKTSGKTQTFLTELKPESAQVKPRCGEYANSNPDLIGSVRRATRPIVSSSVTKSLDDLERVRERHMHEYEESLVELQKLKAGCEDVEFDMKIPRRRFAPFTVKLPRCPIIASLRSKIRYTEGQLNHLRNRFNNLSSKFYKPPAEEKEEEGESDDEEMNKKHKELLQDTFKMFVEKTSREQSDLEDRPFTNLPQIRDRRKSRRRSSMIPIDFGKMKDENSCSNAMYDLLSKTSRDNHIEVIENPFDTGTIPDVTRSRLLLECKKDNSMHVWLGFKSRTQMEKALRENPGAIKQIPAALLALAEGDEENEAKNLDDEEFTDSAESSDGDEDLRFKVFDERKMKLKRKRKGRKSVQINEEVQSRTID